MLSWSSLIFRSGGVVALSFLINGCAVDDSPGNANSTQIRTLFCRAVCDYTWRCIQFTNATCITGCLDANSNYFSHVKDDYLEKVAPCISNAACTEWDKMTATCYSSVAPTVTVSAAVIDFCKTMSAKFFECFYRDEDLTICASDFAAWDDSGVTRAKVCATSTCAALNDCFDSAFSGGN